MIEIKVGEFLRSHIDKIIELCKVDKEVFENLQNNEYCNRTFSLNSRYSLINKLSDIQERGIFSRWYKDNYTIDDEIYRVCSQFGGNHLIQNINASSYHGERLLKYFKEKNLLKDEFKNEEIQFIVASVKENNITSDLNIHVSRPLNQILYGPPGTGKTYNTINKALEIIDGEVPFDRADAKRRFEELRDAGQIEFVTFHQSYGYEEFVEGIKAKTIDGNISYDVEGGVFKELSDEALKVDSKSILKALDNYLEENNKHDFTIKDNIINITKNQNGGYNFSNHHSISRDNAYKCMKIFFDANDIEKITADDLRDIGAESHRYTYFHFIKKFYTLLVDSIDNTNLKDKNYILIIDEINRGNISKIFGELITLIESSKRIGASEEIQLRLPYSNDVFGVPSNLYIIGTMNTADRSIALMDTALRRRFDFVEMMPKPELLKDLDIEGIHLELFLKKINERVEYLYDRDHTIGHAYFM